MATNTLQVSSPQIMKPNEDRSVNISNNTKEDNQTKDSNSISQDKYSQERNLSLVQKSVDSEVCRIMSNNNLKLFNVYINFLFVKHNGYHIKIYIRLEY